MIRYFLRAAGKTFQVGSSRLTLKLLRLSELSALVGFGGIMCVVPPGDCAGGGIIGGGRGLSTRVEVVEVAFEMTEFVGFLYDRSCSNC